MGRWGRFAKGCLTGGLIALATSAWADGVLRDGVGAISSGRGGTNLAFGDNGEVLLDNPAGMMQVAGNGLVECGGDLFLTDLSYSDVDNPSANAHNNPLPMGQLSIIRRSEDGLWAYGLGAFSQAGFAAVYDMNGPFPFSGTQRYKSMGALGRILPGASVQLTDRLSAGGTLGVAVSHMELEAPYFLQGPHPFAGTPTLIDFQGSGAAMSWSVGMQYVLDDRTTFGASFTGETHFELDGNTRLNIPGLGATRFDSTMNVQWPSILGAGVRHQLTPCTVVATDVIWMGWASAFENFDLRLNSPDNPQIAALTGPSLLERFPLAWRDTVSVRVGLERDLGCCRVLRTGYVYHRNPIPADTLTPLIQATLQHAVSVGYGWKLAEYQLDLAYQFSWSADQDVATSDFLGGDFNNATHSSKAHWLMASVVKRF